MSKARSQSGHASGQPFPHAVFENVAQDDSASVDLAVYEFNPSKHDLSHKSWSPTPPRQSITAGLIEDQFDFMVACTTVYVCPLYSCGYLYREPRYLREHIQSHLRNRSHHCKRCYKIFSNSDLLAQHDKLHTHAAEGNVLARFQLNLADEDTILRGEKMRALKVRGVLQEDSGEPGRVRIETVVSDYVANNESDDASSGSMPSTKAYVCPLYSCGRLYREPGYLRDHIRSHTTDKPYQCELCYKKFSRMDLLTQHHQTHARADNGDPQAHLDLERADEEETMLMGEKICEVEVRGEVEDVAGEPGQLRGIGVVCIYPSSNADQAIVTNPVDNYAEVAASPPPSNFPYPGIIKHNPNAYWQSHQDVRLEQSVLYSQTALQYDPLDYGPSHPTPGAVRRLRNATPLQSHQNIPGVVQQTSIGGLDTAFMVGAALRYHPYGPARHAV